MDTRKKVNLTIMKGFLDYIDLEMASLILEQELDMMQQEAFIQGYEYAITILKESLVKNKERTKR